MKNKVLKISLTAIFLVLSSKQINANSIQPGCYTGRGVCGGGGGGAFTVEDQLKTCRATPENKEDCLKIFCIDKSAGQSTYSPDQLKQICSGLGYGTAPAVSKQPVAKPSLAPSPQKSPELSPAASAEMAAPSPVEEVKQFTWQNRIRTFFANLFKNLFGKK